MPIKNIAGRKLCAFVSLVLFFHLASAARVPIPPPQIPVPAFILVEQSGAVLAEKNADQRMEPASLVKIMTVFVTGRALAGNLIALDESTVVSEKAWKMEGSRMFIEVGKSVTVDQLLQGVIVQSGNDASVALAEHVSGTEETFTALMNEYATELGMSNTRYANSTGLPNPDNYTTPRDLVTLSRALISEFPDLYARFAISEYTFNDIRQPNRNRLLSRGGGVDGIKTGHTEAAGYCLVASARRGAMRNLSVVMGADSDSARTEASDALLNYGFRFFEHRDVYATTDVVATGVVWQGEQNEVQIGPAQAIRLTLPKGAYEEIEAQAQINDPIIAPVARGQPLGRLSLKLDGEVIHESELVALAGVSSGSLITRWRDAVLLWFE
ncbi:MAG: D-alanyl-D-alanine carboxypeptidase family protein [Pseudomonadota bacterium]